MKSFPLEYLGEATVDKRLSNPMIPWVVAQIKKGGTVKPVMVCVEDGVLRCWDVEEGESQARDRHRHPLAHVSRLTVTPTTLFYAVRHADHQLLTCHLYRSHDPELMMEVVSDMREQSSALTAQVQASPAHAPPLSRAASVTVCPDISPSSSQFFEVLYIGKIKVSHKRVPESFIDDALDKFNLLEQSRKLSEQTNSQERAEEVLRQRPSVPGGFGSTETLQDNSSDFQPHEVLGRKRSGSAGSVLLSNKETLERLRELAGRRCGAGGGREEHNRTMVFHVGRSDLRLISPDRKQVLLHKYIKDILLSLQGVKHGCHFAFVCRESTLEPQYIGYVFKCESPSVAAEVVNGIRQALGCGRKDGGGRVVAAGPVVSCERCPLVWYHKLCLDVDHNSQDISAQVNAVLKRVDSLPEDEQVVVETKLAGAAALEPTNSRERLELLMMLLRAHCEAKQASHVHDIPHSRQENHYLSGGDTIFMRAKRSLTHSFDQLLKRKGSRDDLKLPINHPAFLSKDCDSVALDSRSGSGSPGEENSDSEERPTSLIKDIFMKVAANGGQRSSAGETESDEEDRPSSWRQAIFNTVVTPSKPSPTPTDRRDREYLRSLWKKAINQQVLLIRMEKENARLTARQEEANVKRMKLEYDDLGSGGGGEGSPLWDQVLLKSSPRYLDPSLLNQALSQGVGRSRRGEVWLGLVETWRSRPWATVPTVEQFPNLEVPYDQLLKQLTSHQHAILIDLGRTFPSHPYFRSALGPGQLSLFNLLKAYSLLDPEVGYCQGLAFVAAVLLLHMSEEESFWLLKEVMLVGGVRRRYLPVMSALQVLLYQLSRLLRDTHPRLHRHFDKHDVSPTLYAAPWFVTFFSSQFPLGFVARVFDLMLADSADVLLKVGLALLGQHEERLLRCHSFETITHYLKKDLPVVDSTLMDNIVEQVLSKDISRELTEFGVEYHVLYEEMSSPRPETKKLKQLQLSNQALISQNKSLTHQLQAANNDIKRLESSRSSYLGQINKLEAEVKRLEELVQRNGGTGVVERRPARSAPLRVIEDAPLRVIEDPPTHRNLSQRMSDLFRAPPETLPGRRLTDQEKESLLSRLRGKREGSTDPSKPLKSSQSWLEAEPGGLPLDSNGVQVSYGGATRLRTMRPLRSSNTLHSIPLRIEESHDPVAHKIKATMNKVTTLFDPPPSS